jgi:phage major head subunit gpT-like protein
MLGLGDAPTMSNAGKKGASAEVGMGSGANMAHRSTREAPEAEFEDDAAGEYSPLRSRVGVCKTRAVRVDHVCVFAVLCGHLVRVWCTMSRP